MKVCAGLCMQMRVFSCGRNTWQPSCAAAGSVHCTWHMRPCAILHLVHAALCHLSAFARPPPLYQPTVPRDHALPCLQTVLRGGTLITGVDQAEMLFRWVLFVRRAWELFVRHAYSCRIQAVQRGPAGLFLLSRCVHFRASLCVCTLYRNENLRYRECAPVKRRGASPPELQPAGTAL